MAAAFIDSLAGEYRRYKTLAEGAMKQLRDDELSQTPYGAANSVVTLVWHIAGNLESRFTDFLETDGEKPWRDREAEFERRVATRDEVSAKWERGWAALFTALAALDDQDLQARTVTIRGVPLSVQDALLRSLAHASYHVGQIVALARAIRGPSWQFMSIPPGRSAEYNANPTLEKPPRES